MPDDPPRHRREDQLTLLRCPCLDLALEFDRVHVGALGPLRGLGWPIPSGLLRPCIARWSRPSRGKSALDMEAPPAPVDITFDQGRRLAPAKTSEETRQYERCPEGRPPRRSQLAGDLPQDGELEGYICGGLLQTAQHPNLAADL